MRNIVERMRNMSTHLTLTADKSGTVILKIDADSATVSTHFQGMAVWQCTQEQEDDKVSATMDIKKFLTFLAWDIVHPDGAKCNVLQDKMVNLFLHVADYLKINYFIPAMTT